MNPSQTGPETMDQVVKVVMDVAAGLSEAVPSAAMLKSPNQSLKNVSSENGPVERFSYVMLRRVSFLTHTAFDVIVLACMLKLICSVMNRSMRLQVRMCVGCLKSTARSKHFSTLLQTEEWSL